MTSHALLAQFQATPLRHFGRHHYYFRLGKYLTLIHLVLQRLFLQMGLKRKRHEQPGQHLPRNHWPVKKVCIARF